MNLNTTKKINYMDEKIIKQLFTKQELKEYSYWAINKLAKIRFENKKVTEFIDHFESVSPEAGVYRNCLFQKRVLSCNEMNIRCTDKRRQKRLTENNY